MKSELEQQLLDAFPALFTDQLRRAGFQCRDGWFYLLGRLASNLVKISEDADIEPPKIDVVKQKFGTLRCFVTSDNSDTRKRIELVAIDSRNICEVCGENGQWRADTGWIQTLCNAHYEAYKEKGRCRFD